MTKTNFALHIATAALLALSTHTGAVEYGIAAKYVKDQNLIYDPGVICFWDYEDGLNFRYGWQSGIPHYVLGNNPANVLLGKYSIRADLYEGTHGYGGNHFYLLEKPELIMYQRWYRKLEVGTQYTVYGLKNHGMGGYGPGHSATEVFGGAGNRPDGTDKFWAISGPGLDGDGNIRAGVYYYHPDQIGGYGDGGVFGPILEIGVWHCIELMVKMNTIGQKDGEIKVWVNGNPEFSRTGMRWRDIPELAINVVTDLVYNPIPKDEAIWFDNRVVARKYIGPASGAGPNAAPIPANPPPAPRDTLVPVVSNIYPAPNATGVAAKTVLSFTIKDDRGVDSNTIVLRVNGQNAKPRITGYQRELSITYPYSLPAGIVVPCSIDAKDVSGNTMPTKSYSFTVVGTPGITERAIASKANELRVKKACDLLGRKMKIDPGKPSAGRRAQGAHVSYGSDKKARFTVVVPK